MRIASSSAPRPLQCNCRNRMTRPLLEFLILLLPSTNFAPLLAQNQPKPVTPSQQPAAIQVHEAKPADVASPDAILAAAYDVISGPAGREREGAHALAILSRRPID
jgi:hypothetical protein